MEKNNQRNSDEIKVRILQFAKEQKLIMGDFYKKISVPPSNFGGKSMESSLSSAKISEILKMYPELSADWLLLGKGEMLRKNNPKSINIASGPQSNAGSGNLTVEAPSQLLAIIASQQETINRQACIIDRLSK